MGKENKMNKQKVAFSQTQVARLPIKPTQHGSLGKLPHAYIYHWRRIGDWIYLF